MVVVVYLIIGICFKEALETISSLFLVLLFARIQVVRLIFK